MYSHLVLSTTGKDEDEDGLLEAWEIMKLDLHADMVVLAACETARGRIGAGEGSHRYVVGLLRGGQSNDSGKPVESRFP